MGPSRLLKGRKSTVQQIVQEEEEEMGQEELNEEEENKREENEEVITVERKKTLRKLSSLDTTASTPSFYEPVNFSWEEQQEGNKDYGKTTEEILKMIEDEADDE